MVDNLIVGLILTCMGIIIIAFGVEIVLRWYTRRCVKKIEKDFDKIMGEMEDWEKDEDG